MVMDLNLEIRYYLTCTSTLNYRFVFLYQYELLLVVQNIVVVATNFFSVLHGRLQYAFFDLAKNSYVYDVTTKIQWWIGYANFKIGHIWEMYFWQVEHFYLNPMLHPIFLLIFGTVIPRLARFLIARICIAQFFEGAKNNFHSTILYLSYTTK